MSMSIALLKQYNMLNRLSLVLLKKNPPYLAA
jgi:hypothetical protein